MSGSERSRWVGQIAPASGGGGGGGATDLDGLSDVAVSGATTGHVLRHNGTSFVNVLGTTHFDAAGAAAAAQAASQPLDSDLTAIAALSTTSYGRALLALANQAALTALVANGSETLPGILEIATQAETNTGTDDARAVTPLKLQTRIAAHSQPLDSDLTAIAALTTTSYGRAFLTLANQAALVALLPVYAEDSLALHKAGAETVTGAKTLDTPLIQTQVSTPSTPPSGKNAGPYFKTNGLPYYLNPAGIEVPFNVGDAVAALHTNPDFESQTAGVVDTWDATWQTNGSVASSTSEAFLGSRSALITLSASGYQFFTTDTLTVSPGDVMEFAVYAKKVTGTPQISLGLLTKASGTPDLAAVDAASTQQTGSATTLAAGYVRYSQSFTVPSGHTVARWTIYVSAAAAASARLDNSSSRKTVASVADLDWVKRKVAAATTVNVATLAGGAPSTLDGVTLVANDRVLVKDQTTAAQNGIYTVTTLGSGSNGTWTRASDMSNAADCAAAMVSVKAGTTNGGTRWGTSFKSTDTVGTTAMKWWLIDFTDAASLTPNAGFAGSVQYTRRAGQVTVNVDLTAASWPAAYALTTSSLPVGFRPPWTIYATARSGSSLRGYSISTAGAITGDIAGTVSMAGAVSFPAA